MSSDHDKKYDVIKSTPLIPLQNIVMNAWCLVCSITGTFLMDRVGRKTLCLVAITGMSCFMLILGGLTKGTVP